MTPKEKAKELVDIFYQTTPNEAWYNPPLGSLSMEYKSWEQAKQCALIAANEVLDHVDMVGDEAAITYWQEVKQEMELL